MENLAIRDLASIPRFFVETPPGRINRNYYRPVYLATLAVDHAIWGLEPAGYHLTNLLWHVAASLLAFLFFVRRLGSREAALAAALLFAAHPVHGEAVYLVHYRAAVVATTLFLAALLLHGRRGLAARVATPVAAILAMAAKEEAVVFPVAIVLHDLYFDRPRGARAAAARYLGPIAAAGVYLAARAALCEPSGVSYFGGKPWDVVLRTVTEVQAYGARILFVPAGLAGTYGPDVFPETESFADLPFLGAAAGVVLLLALAGLLRRRQPLVSFAILFHFVALAPTMHLVRLPVLFGERFLYLASLGFCLAAGAGYRGLAERAWGRPAAVGLAVAVTLGFGALTLLRSFDWRDELTFWRATSEERPASLQARYGLAYALLRAGRCADALVHYDLAAATAPDTPDGRQVHLERALCYLRTKQADQAIAAADEWLRRHPEDVGMQRLRKSAREMKERALSGGAP